MKLKSSKFSKEKDGTPDEKCANTALKLAQSAAEAYSCRPAQLPVVLAWAPGL